jgi:hypothetical protein
MDRTDVRMIKRRSGAGFAPETLQGLRILGDIVRQEFERHEAPELSVFRLVNHTHPATAQLLDDAVVRDGLTDQLKRTFTLGRNLRVDAPASQRRKRTTPRAKKRIVEGRTITR